MNNSHTPPSPFQPTTRSSTRVLRDDAFGMALHERGYVTVPFLSDDEVCDLSAGYLRLRRDATQPEADDGLTIDFMRPDRHMMRAVEELLAPVWSAHLPRHFVDYAPVVSTFVTKHPGQSSEMLLHHESTFSFLDVPTYNIWIPLVDVTTERNNGVLELIPGTEHLEYGYVGFNTPVLFRPFEEFLVRHGTRLNVRAGEAVIYDTRMLHRSPSNACGSVRPAVAAALAPSDAPLVHVVAKGNRSGLLYSVDTDFFVDNHPMDVPESIDARYPVIEEVSLAGPLSAHDIAGSVGMTERPVPDVMVPQDIGGTVGAERLDQCSSSLEVSDLPSMDQAERGPIGATGVTVGAVSGGVAARSLVRNWRQRVSGLTVGSFGDVVATRLRDAVGIALEPGSRTEIELAWRRGGTLSTIDCAALGSGVIAGDRAAQLDPGVSVDIPRSQCVTIWNDGQGPAAVVIWRRESPVSVLSSLFRRS